MCRESLEAAKSPGVEWRDRSRKVRRLLWEEEGRKGVNYLKLRQSDLLH